VAIALVQLKTAAATSLTLNSATTAGNCLVVGFTDEGGATTVTAVKLGGAADNFAQLVSVSGSGKSTSLAALWADPSCAGGQTAVAVTPGTAAVSPTMWAAEFSGIVTASPLDKSSSGTGTTSTWDSGATATTTQAVELWLGAVCAASSSATGPGAPWNNTTVADGSGDNQVYGYQIVSSTGTADYSGTGGGTGSWAAVVATLKGAASTSGTVQPRPTLPPPRRRKARAWLRFAPVTTTNAAPAAPVSGTVQPQPTLPPPRRRLARAWTWFVPVATANAVPMVPGTVQSRATLPHRRRRWAQRAAIRFVPATTTNAHRQLIVSLASQAGIDDYGNAFPLGILATEGEIEGPKFVGQNFTISTAGAFFYSGIPALGNLIASIAPSGGADGLGNAFLAGTTSYIFDGTQYTALNMQGGILTWYQAATGAGPWVQQAAINFLGSDVAGTATIQLNAGATRLVSSAAAVIPTFNPGITSLPHDNNSGSTWVSGERAFMNNNWVDTVNSNFSTIMTILRNVGIIS
jgi:hypothetical protein